MAAARCATVMSPVIDRPSSARMPRNVPPPVVEFTTSVSVLPTTTTVASGRPCSPWAGLPNVPNELAAAFFARSNSIVTVLLGARIAPFPVT